MASQALWLILTGCILATFMWRLLGVIVVRKIALQGDFYEWVNCVSYALVAGLIFRMIFLPQSDLATLAIWSRILSVALAFAAYFLFRKNLLAGVLTGSASLSILASMNF